MTMTDPERQQKILTLLADDHFRCLELCQLLLEEIVDHNGEYHYMTSPAVVELVKKRLSTETRLAQEK